MFYDESGWGLPGRTLSNSWEPPPPVAADISASADDEKQYYQALSGYWPPRPTFSAG